MASEKISFLAKHTNCACPGIGTLGGAVLYRYCAYMILLNTPNHPRHIDGLKGIIFSPFIHDKYHFEHIISNTLPIMVLLTVLINAYPRVWFGVLVFIHLLSGILVMAFCT